jgi:molybdopterin synthase sulfur carrier subunit
MKIRVRFFATFKDLFSGEGKEIELESGSNIQDLLNLLCDTGQRREALFDNSGKLRPYIQVLKNRKPIQSLGGIRVELKEGDLVGILPPVFGG